MLFVYFVYIVRAILLSNVYLFIFFFVPMLLLYFCLFGDCINKFIVYILVLLFIILRIFVTICRIVSNNLGHCLIKISWIVHDFIKLHTFIRHHNRLTPVIQLVKLPWKVYQIWHSVSNSYVKLNGDINCLNILYA